MKIYVLTISEVFDFEDFSHKPKAFYKFEDAVAEMNSISNGFEKETDIESEIDGDSWVIEARAWSCSASQFMMLILMADIVNTILQLKLIKWR